ncbi:MAG: hypothetical protein D6733_07245 [Methanobacteriota archaeon]|nr:MAG: hypothetical protein D6733_07245 [Euryarchaeota archaeon]
MKPLPMPERGSKTVTAVEVAEYADKSQVAIPLFMVSGAEDGPTLLLNAAVHGNELNGVEIVRKVMAGLDPGELCGTVMGVPIVNVMAYNAGLRWDPLDPKDMNRVFPGDRDGSLTEQVAYTFFNRIAKNADYIVDFHSAEYPEVFLPHTRIRTGDRTGRSLLLVNAFGTEIVWRRKGPEGMLQVRAIKERIPTITVEIGAGGVVDPGGVELGIEGVHNVLKVLGMMKGTALVPEQQILITKTRSWFRSPIGGIFEPGVGLGDVVLEGDLIGRILNPFSYEEIELRAPSKGVVAGLRTHPVVRTGTRLFFLLEYRKDGGKGIDPKNLIKVPKLPNTRYRENRLLKKIMEIEGSSGHGH